jgi:hypothetical protein
MAGAFGQQRKAAYWAAFFAASMSASERIVITAIWLVR